MERYMETYSFERTGNGVVAKFGEKPVAEYSNEGVLMKILDPTSLPVQECVPMMMARCMV